jgi:hypothetical protein
MTGGGWGSMIAVIIDAAMGGYQKRDRASQRQLQGQRALAAAEVQKQQIASDAAIKLATIQKETAALQASRPPMISPTLIVGGGLVAVLLLTRRRNGRAKR